MPRRNRLSAFELAYAGIFTGMGIATVLLIAIIVFLGSLGVDVELSLLSILGILASGVLQFTKLNSVEDPYVGRSKVRGAYRAHESTGHFAVVQFSMSIRRWYWIHVWWTCWPATGVVLALALLSLALRFH